MFGKLARLMYRRRWYVIATWLVVLVVSGAGAARLNSVLGPGDWVLPGSESDHASQILDHTFHQNGQKVSLVIIHSPGSTVADGEMRRVVGEIASAIQHDPALRVDYLDNPVQSGNAQLISKDRHAVAIMFSSTLAESKLEGQIEHLRSLVHRPGYTTHVVGFAAGNYDYSMGSKEDLAKGDSIVLPILIVVLLLVFGTLVAAGLPLIVALFSIMLSMALVYIFAHWLNTSVYVTNVLTALGLGVAIDYSLFILYRFRDELKVWGNDIESAVVRTMETTGRAVFFSGITVAVGLASLMMTGLSFMQSMGLGGILVPLTSLLVSMTLLPALLGVLGTKVNRLRVIPTRFLRTGDGGIWRRVAAVVMHRPVLMGAPVLILLLAMIYPVTKIGWSYGSIKNAPHQLDSVKGTVFMQRNFKGAPDPIRVVIQHQGPGTILSPREMSAIRSLEGAIRKNPEAANVVGPAEFVPKQGVPSPAQQRQLTGRYLSADQRTAAILVAPRHIVGTRETEGLVRDIRALVPRTAGSILNDTDVYVGGAQAVYTDYNDALYRHFPLIVAIVLVLTYAFLFYAFRSVFLPFKAVLLNVLSVTAAFGMLQIVFQGGIGSDILHFTPETGLTPWVPIFLFAFLFGLSMDYEVFLLSRVQEAYHVTGDNRAAVVTGLENTGRLITSAAAIMVIAFSAMMIGSSIQLKEFGFGMVASVALDATLIRLVLVPSIMQLMGDWNWWVPSLLAGFASRGAGFAEGEARPATAEPEGIESAA